MVNLVMKSIGAISGEKILGLGLTLCGSPSQSVFHNPASFPAEMRTTEPGL